MSFEVEVNNLETLKLANQQRAQDIYRNEGECKDLNECRKINQQLNDRLRGFGVSDKKSRELLYMIDPSKSIYNEPIKSEFTPEMYMLNPNKYDKLTESEYMLFPKSNSPILKKVYEERKKFKIYPHMFSQYQQLLDQDNKTYTSEESQDVIGGPDAIPMKFQLEDIKQPLKKPSGYDYDMKTIDNSDTSGYQISPDQRDYEFTKNPDQWSEDLKKRDLIEHFEGSSLEKSKIHRVKKYIKEASPNITELKLKIKEENQENDLIRLKKLEIHQFNHPNPNTLNLIEKLKEKIGSSSVPEHRKQILMGDPVSGTA